MISNNTTLNELLSDLNGLDEKKRTRLGSWKPLGRLPCWLSKIDGNPPGLLRIKRANRYLSYQERKIVKLVEKNELNKAVILWCMLAKNSTTYQFSLYNRVVPNWYWSKTFGDSLRELRICMNKLRKWDLVLQLKRFYILKKNGKYRPIGSPSIPSRVISKSLNDLIYLIQMKEFKEFQHGYRMEKGTHTALMRAWKEIAINGGKNIMEFDFKAFFNSVHLSWVYISLRERSTKLAALVKQVVSNVEYTLPIPFDMMPIGESELHYKGTSKRWKVKEPERGEIVPKDYKARPIKIESTRLAQTSTFEVRRLGTNRYKKGRPIYRSMYTERVLWRWMNDPKHWIIKPLIIRTGMPQGLSISPVLATLVLEWLSPPQGLVMYADDGLIIRKDEDFSEFEEWCAKLRNFGVEIEPSKTCRVEGSFKFLGVEFDVERKTVSYQDSKITWAGWNLKSPELENKFALWFKTVAQFYGKKTAGWSWDIVKGSCCWEHRNQMGWIRYLTTMFWGLWSAKIYKEQRYFLMKGCYNVSGLSTLCAGDVLSHLKDITLVKKKQLQIPRKEKNNKVHIDRGKYFERNLNSVNWLGWF